jgi:hypothetical protein
MSPVHGALGFCRMPLAFGSCGGMARRPMPYGVPLFLRSFASLRYAVTPLK